MACSKGTGGMGFRSIHNFNTSLIEKQYWRLQSDDNSLLARIFKSRYYPNCNITKALVGFAPNYAWGSILSAKESVSKGFRWIMGTGAKVWVWQDNWILGIPSSRPLSNNSSLDRDAMVYDLIDQDLGYWNCKLVLSCFNAHEAHHIFSIPLSMRKPNDEIFWHAEKMVVVRSIQLTIACRMKCFSRNWGHPLRPQIGCESYYGTPTFILV